MEKDLLQQWKQQRSSERILEIDIPLSYGVFEIIHPDEEINKVEFAWDPSSVNKDSGIFIKVNTLTSIYKLIDLTLVFVSGVSEDITHTLSDRITFI